MEEYFWFQWNTQEGVYKGIINTQIRCDDDGRDEHNDGIYGNCIYTSGESSIIKYRFVEYKNIIGDATDVDWQNCLTIAKGIIKSVNTIEALNNYIGWK